MKNIKDLLKLAVDEHEQIIDKIDAMDNHDALLKVIESKPFDQDEDQAFVTFIADELKKQPTPLLLMSKDQLRHVFWKLTVALKNPDADIALLALHTTAQELIHLDFSMQALSDGRAQQAPALFNSVLLLKALKECIAGEGSQVKAALVQQVEKGHSFRGVYTTLVLDAIIFLKQKSASSNKLSQYLAFICETFGLPYEMLKVFFETNDTEISYVDFAKAIAAAPLPVVSYPKIAEVITTKSEAGTKSKSTSDGASLYPVIDKKILETIDENNRLFAKKVKEGTELYFKRKTRPISVFKAAHIKEMTTGYPHKVAVSVFEYLVIKNDEYTTDRLALSIKECLGDTKFINSAEDFAQTLRQAFIKSTQSKEFKPVKDMNVFSDSLAEILALYQGVSVASLFKAPKLMDLDSLWFDFFAEVSKAKADDPNQAGYNRIQLLENVFSQAINETINFYAEEIPPMYEFFSKLVENFQRKVLSSSGNPWKERYDLLNAILDKICRLYLQVDYKTLIQGDHYLNYNKLPSIFMRKVLLPYLSADGAVLDEKTMQFIEAITLGGGYSVKNHFESDKDFETEKECADKEKSRDILKGLVSLMDYLRTAAMHNIPQKSFLSFSVFSEDEATLMHKFVAKLGREDLSKGTLGVRLMLICKKLQDVSCLEANDLIRSIQSSHAAIEYLKNHNVQALVPEMKIDYSQYRTRENGRSYFVKFKQNK